MNKTATYLILLMLFIFPIPITANSSIPIQSGHINDGRGTDFNEVDFWKKVDASSASVESLGEKRFSHPIEILDASSGGLGGAGIREILQ